jgi:hypothetical protein
MPARRRRFFLHDNFERPPRLLGIAAVAAFGAIVAGLIVGQPYLAVGAAAVLALVIASLFAGWYRFGWLLAERGLLELRCGWFRLVPWSRVRGVRWADDQAELETDRGTLAFGRRMVGWAELAAAIEARLAGPEPVPQEVVLPPELVAAWLGLPAGEPLGCPSRLHRWAWPCFLASAIMLLGAALCSSAAWVGPLVELALLAPVLLGMLSLVVSEVRALPEGLDVRRGRRWQRYAWGSLWSLQRRGGDWRLETRDGPVPLPSWLAGRDRLLEVIRKAIAAREAGQALPRMAADVPESALSRAEAQVDAGRGLSRGREESGPPARS